MMYPRLKLAKNLLADDGVIFISIDDSEIENLKKVCNEIFGEENFIANINWHKKTQPSFLNKEISNVKEYILFYRKNSKKIVTKGGLTDVNKKIEMINISNSVSERYLQKENVLVKNESFNGLLEKGLYGNGNLKIELLNDVHINNGHPNQNLLLKGRFKWVQEKMNDSFDEGDIYHIKNTETLRPTVEKANKKANVKPLLDLLSKKLNDKIPTNTDGTNELKQLFGGISPMDYPKPSKLLKYLIDSITFDNNKYIILDFFSGSATTADALIQLNSELHKKHKFILVQIPEIDSYNGDFEYKNIAEIGKERIRRAGDKILQESNNKNLDIGFKVFKLDSSNLKKWYPDYKDPEQAVLTSVNNIKEDRTKFDLLYEIMLKYGIDLTLPIEEYEIANEKIYSVGFGALLICLDNEITSEIATEIIKLKEELSPETTRVVFKDNGFKSDSDKTNIKETLKTNGIDEFITI
ncbi:MAG: DNA methylase [Methanobrevibacter sp. CfCl-M3]